MYEASQRRLDVSRTTSLDADQAEYLAPMAPAVKNVGNLLHMADNLGKAVGTLVNAMTDDETGSGSDEDLAVPRHTNLNWLSFLRLHLYIFALRTNVTCDEVNILL